ncbi:MAG TPA: hypothetical protein VIY52_05810 [Streptosporangiaceae bacterium]
MVDADGRDRHHGPFGIIQRGQTATADVEQVEVVVAHHERATLRVGDVFLKIDADQTRTDVEVEAMAMAPVPTAEVLWRKPPVLALAALPGPALGRLGEPSTASPAAWAAAGAAAAMLHDAPLPPWPGRSLDEVASHLDGECEWLVMNGVLPRRRGHAQPPGCRGCAPAVDTGVHARRPAGHPRVRRRCAIAPPVSTIAAVSRRDAARRAVHRVFIDM